MKDVKTNLGLLLALFICSLALYWPALNGGPLVDDFRLLEASKNGGWLDNFSATPPGIPGVFWRPVVSIFLKLEWLLFHLNFGGYRATSALLGAITALAIYGFVFKVTNVRWAGIVSALFFIAWPSHPETM